MISRFLCCRHGSLLFHEAESGLRAWFEENGLDATVIIEMHPLDAELTSWLLYLSVKDKDGLATVRDGKLVIDVVYRITTPGRPEWFDACVAQLCWHQEEEE